MIVTRIMAGPIGTNCYIVHNGLNALIVDPGGHPAKIINYLIKEKVKPQAILLTHAHFDHIGGIDRLRSYYNLDVYLNDHEFNWPENPELNGSLFLMNDKITAGHADYRLFPGEKCIGDICFEVIHTPGHSPGSVSFIFPEDRFILGGDVLFYQGAGRTDLYGGDFEELKNTVYESIYCLADDYTIYPGHGPSTRIGEEKRHNPVFPYKY